MTHRFRILALGLASLLLLSSLEAQARPTVSGTLESFNPGARRLQIKRADGVVKTVVLTPGAAFEIYGNPVAPSSFRQGMQVAVRVVGSLVDDPLQADLLTDLGSSRRYVSTTATSPYNTPVGTYATGGGAGGVSPGLTGPGGPYAGPSVLGPLGHGGNFPGSLTNPLDPIPHNNSAFPQQIPGSPGMPAQPAPLGSPYTGQVVSQQPGLTPTAPAPNPYAPAPAPAANPYGAPGANPYGTPGASPYGAPGANPYGTPGASPYGAPGANPYGTPGASPYGAPGANPYGTPGASPYGAPGGNAAMIDGGEVQGSGPSSMFGGHDEEDEDEDGGFGFNPQGGPMGMQVLQFQGRIHSVDPYNRVITVVPAGAVYTLQVAIPSGLPVVHGATRQAVPLESLHPGQGIDVHGLRNAAGIVEARALAVTQ